MCDPVLLDRLITLFDRQSHNLTIFMDGIARYIGTHPDFGVSGREIVHSYKSRLKDKKHLRDKIIRKINSGKDINEVSFFFELTDLAGVRILHLFQQDFNAIDKVIRQKIDEGDWIFAERPKAYTWDPEAAAYFGNFKLDVSEKPTSYPSVHYLVKPRQESPLCCEIQVRT